jgi:RNA recognition motif. (a.k.a. RRM, RBD, or RNP domain)
MGRGYSNSDSNYDRPQPSFQAGPSRGGFGGPTSSGPSTYGSSSGGNKVLAQNLSFSVTEDDLKEFFLENKVRAIKVMIMKNERGQSTGMAIIEFSSNQDADYVVKNLSGTDVGGRQVNFKFQGGGGGAPSGAGRGRGFGGY